MYNNSNRPPRNPFLEAVNARKLLWGIIIANCIFFFLYPDPARNPWVLYPEAVQQGKIWLIFTSIFQHADFMHLLMNMYGLWLFGKYTSSIMGWKKFLLLYCVSGLAGNLVYMLFFWDKPFYLLGASGAVFGITLAMAMLLPHAQFGFIFFPAPIKAPTLIIIYTAIEIFSQIFAPGSGVAHLAHLGGFLGAYIVMKILFRNNIPWDPLGFLFRNSSVNPGGTNARTRFTFHSSPGKNAAPSESAAADNDDDGSPVSPQEINYLLDKISEKGINSLTPREHKRLRRVREEMKASR